MTLKQHKIHGQSTIEVIAGILVLIPIALFAIDGVTLFMGASLNSQVCRDAARAAANGPPTVMSPTLTPRQRAEAVVRRTQKNEGAVRLQPDVVCRESVTRVPTPPWGGIVEGTVTVTTAVDVYPPFLLKCTMPRVTLRNEQTFPFTYVLASAYTINARSNPAVPLPPPPGGRPNPVDTFANNNRTPTMAVPNMANLRVGPDTSTSSTAGR